MAGARAAAGGEFAGAPFTCLTSTKVQILTRNRGAGGGEGVAGARAAVGGGARGELAGVLYLLYWYSLLALLEGRVGQFGGVGGGARGELAGALYLLYSVYLLY